MKEINTKIDDLDKTLYIVFNFFLVFPIVTKNYVRDFIQTVST